jgi:hypothetical protein
VHACVHIGECMCVYVTVYVYCVSQKKKSRLRMTVTWSRTKSDRRLIQIPT